MEDVPGRYPFDDGLLGCPLHDHRGVSRGIDFRAIPHGQACRRPDEPPYRPGLRDLQGLAIQVFQAPCRFVDPGRGGRHDRVPQFPGSPLRHCSLDRRSIIQANDRIGFQHDADLRSCRPSLRDFPPGLQKMDSFGFLADRPKRPSPLNGDGLFNLVEARSIELRSDSGQPDRLYERSHRFRVGFKLPVTGSLLPSPLVLAGVRVRFLRSGPPFWRL